MAEKAPGEPVSELATVVAEKVPAVTTSPYLTTAYWWEKLTSDGVKQFIAGGVAGGVSRTVVSPLERMKILFQVQGPEPAQYRGILPTLAKIWREEGVRGYMRGNGTNVIRIVPYSAVQFAAYEQFKRMLMEPGKNELDTPRRLASGALAGITSVAFTYPLDIVRTRLSVQSATARPPAPGVAPAPMPGIWSTMRLMYLEEGGVRALYRGLGPTMLGVAPYVALNFQAYEVLRKYFTPPGESAPTSVNKLLCGALAGSIAQTITYPLDVLRRRMQVTGMKEVGYKYRNTWHAVREVVARESILGLYKGMIPNYLKVAPAIGVSFWSYELCKELLGSK
ncbi:putative mitochondrial carrier protein [Thamnocephalis sphaerospora]|uniref:Putative mitochondrial carrier protein n=1 Tax=Thamnocephalis sphaerospora TaxID=78915 RepID=A0A4V1IW40_9FUNG|nr:putative mitochondrial carrier protein [Thamnocephalis sphaerospora]|eukprot:RKP06229.1 putative mitochondrial carrier protein [Thamnocephalis sphaerospora]